MTLVFSDGFNDGGLGFHKCKKNKHMDNGHTVFGVCVVYGQCVNDNGNMLICKFE